MYKDRRFVPFILMGLAFSVGLILWITLISRYGSGTRAVYAPLWSLKAILEGDRNAYFETAANSLMFIPFGFFLAASGIMKKKHLMLTGIVVPICIEAVQWVCRLGSAELDDVISNAIGMYLGTSLFFIIRCNQGWRVKVKKALPSVCIVIIFIFLFIVCHSKMTNFARMNDREDGAENLLILNGQSGYVSGTGVYVGYLDNGQIAISGSSGIRAWKLIGECTLAPGKYTFTGMTGVKEGVFGIQLEYYDKEADNYTRLTPDIGPVGETSFELKEKTKVRAYIGIYPDAAGGCLARPAIYRD